MAFRYDLEYRTLSPQIVDKEGKFIILHIEIQGSPYSIFNYYGPNDESSQLNVLQLLAEKLRNMKVEDNCQFILAGDWNLIFDKSLDSMGGSPSLKFKSLHKLQSIMIDYNLVDIWRTMNPNLRQFTWRRTNPFIMRRLDIFLKYQMSYSTMLNHVNNSLLFKMVIVQ